jgi:hypothetical protein
MKVWQDNSEVCKFKITFIFSLGNCVKQNLFLISLIFFFNKLLSPPDVSYTHNVYMPYHSINFSLKFRHLNIINFTFKSVHFTGKELGFEYLFILTL